MQWLYVNFCKLPPLASFLLPNSCLQEVSIPYLLHETSAESLVSEAFSSAFLSYRLPAHQHLAGKWEACSLLWLQMYTLTALWIILLLITCMLIPLLHQWVSGLLWSMSWNYILYCYIQRIVGSFCGLLFHISGHPLVKDCAYSMPGRKYCCRCEQYV